MTDATLDRIAGALAGMVLGDALGVPGELWPREKVRSRFGRIEEFLDGPADNIVACYFKAGHYTDDSAQAFVVLEALLKAGTVPPAKTLADDLLEWVRSMNGFEINLLGPSSKASLLAWRQGADAEAVTKLSLTNGAAMRIAPVGCLVEANEHEKLAETVARVSRVTHSTDVAISGAAMVAQAVASAVAGRSWDEIRTDIAAIHPIALVKGEPTWAASVLARLEAFQQTAYPGFKTANIHFPYMRKQTDQYTKKQPAIVYLCSLNIHQSCAACRYSRKYSVKKHRRTIPSFT